jgi:hypothetical protein
VSALETAELSDDQVEAISGMMVERDWEYPPAAIALIAPDDNGRRILMSYRAHLGGSKSKREVFGNREEALAWLTELRG